MRQLYLGFALKPRGRHQDGEAEAKAKQSAVEATIGKAEQAEVAKLEVVAAQAADKEKDLAAKDANGLSDPYVRVTLLPDKKHRLETKIKRRTLNPRWNETFYFEGELYYY